MEMVLCNIKQSACATEQGSVMIPVCFQSNVKLFLWICLSDNLQLPGYRTVLHDGEWHRKMVPYLKTGDTHDEQEAFLDLQRTVR